MEQETQNTEEYLSNLNLSNIYLSLSEETNTDYDLIDITEKINTIIEKVFDKEILTRATDLIQNDQILINNSFILILKETDKIHYRQYGIIFLVFCEYFDLDGNKTFQMMHQKIKNIIEKSTQKIIGDKVYNKVKNRKSNNDIHKDITIISIFDL
jgi:hypothetical protein